MRIAQSELVYIPSILRLRIVTILGDRSTTQIYKQLMIDDGANPLFPDGTFSWTERRLATNRILPSRVEWWIQPRKRTRHVFDTISGILAIPMDAGAICTVSCVFQDFAAGASLARSVQITWHHDIISPLPVYGTAQRIETTIRKDADMGNRRRT